MRWERKKKSLNSEIVKKYIMLVEAIAIIAAFFLIDFFIEIIFNLAVGNEIRYEFGNFLFLAISETARIIVFGALLCTLKKRRTDEEKNINSKTKIIFILLALIIPLFFITISKAACNYIGYGYATDNLELGDWVSVFLTPLAEEITFRGCLISLARNKSVNEKVMIVVSSIAWTMFHPYDIVTIISIFIAGMLYGIIYSKTGSLKYSILSHSIWNLIIILGY